MTTPPMSWRKFDIVDICIPQQWDICALYEVAQQRIQGSHLKMLKKD